MYKIGGRRQHAAAGVELVPGRETFLTLASSALAGIAVRETDGYILSARVADDGRRGYFELLGQDVCTPDAQDGGQEEQGHVDGLRSVSPHAHYTAI